MAQDLIRIGVVLKPQGIRGEIKVRPLTDFPSRFQELSRIFLIPAGGEESIVANMEGFRIQEKSIVLKLEDVDTRQKAEKLVGLEIAIPREECIALPPDSYFVFDLIGMAVVLSTGEALGAVEDVQSLPSQDMLVVRANNGSEILVPLVSEIVTEISLEERQIVVFNLPGLV